MSYSLTLSVDLGASATGLSLEAQLVNMAGANVGSAITTVVEIGGGNYLFDLDPIPDNHRGGVKVQILAGGALRGFRNIEPREGEWMGRLKDGVVPVIGAAGAGTTAALLDNATLVDLSLPLDDDFFADAIVVMTSGTQKGQARRAVFDTSNGAIAISVSPEFTTAPLDGDEFVIVNSSVARAVSDVVWEESLSDHLTGSPGTAAGALSGLAPKQGQTFAIGGSPSASAFETDLPGGNDFWNGQYITFVEGNLAGQSRRITDFVDVDGVVTVSPVFAATPDPDSEFTIVAAPHVAGLVEAILTEALTELAGVPPANATVAQILTWLYMKTKNDSITDDSGTPTKHQVANDAGAIIAESDVTDSGGGGEAKRAKYV